MRTCAEHYARALTHISDTLEHDRNGTQQAHARMSSTRSRTTANTHMACTRYGTCAHASAAHMCMTATPACAQHKQCTTISAPCANSSVLHRDFLGTTYNETIDELLGAPENARNEVLCVMRAHS